MTRTASFFILLLITISFVFLTADEVVAQNSSSTKSSTDTNKPSKEGKKYQVFNRAEAEKKARATYDPVRNAAAQKGDTVVRPMEFFGESAPLSELAKNPQALAKDAGKIMRSDKQPILEDPGETITVDGPPSNVQIDIETPSAASVGTSFEGPGVGLAGFFMTGAPPDTTMAVGPNHIVAWVNSQFAIFNKSGTVVQAPMNGNIFFTGLGNVCETTNRGDPILQYDRLADRWFLSQFAFAAGTTAPYLQCIAVSTTGDPTGTYVRYTISFGSVSPEGFNDYGKLGIFGNAYYTAYNIFGGSPAGFNTGVSLCASDRTKMLAGDPTATTLCAPTAFYGGGASFLPADVDGLEQPSDLTRGGPFIRISTTLNLRMLRLLPNFATSTVTITDGYGGAAGSFINFPVGATTNACNGEGNACVGQPGTTNLLDTLGTRLMYRLAFRNRGGVESLMVTHSVDPDGAGTQTAAVRWYEIRNPLNSPTDPNTGLRPFLYQNGTFNPGASRNRWMGSVAMNKNGDMLVGYSIADNSVGTPLKPSIALAGRSQGDPLSTLQAETIALTGTGSQTGTLTRWGDYSTMQVDPSDDTTFWFTTQYLATDGTFNWRTRIVSASFPGTIATTNGDFNVPANWTNGVPDTAKSGTIPSGVTLMVNTPSTVGNLDVQSGGALVMNANLDVSGALRLGTTINTGTSTLGLGCNATVSGASATNYVIGNIRKDYCQTGAFRYPTGTANGYSPADVNITTLTTNPSSLEIKATQGIRPNLDAAQSAARYWELTETGDLTANLLFNYRDGDVNGTETNYNLHRWITSIPTAVTPFVLNTAANTISTNGVTDFSHWTVGNLSPTVASASISGIVIGRDRLAIPRVVITLTDSSGGVRTVRANNFGYFRFNDVEVGETYVIQAFSKSHLFNPTVFTLDDDITGLEIIPQE